VQSLPAEQSPAKNSSNVLSSERRQEKKYGHLMAALGREQMYQQLQDFLA
jgi:hypothetical protein